MSETRPEEWRTLTTLELALLRSESLGGTMVFTVEVDFDGAMNPELIAQAVQFTLQHHPLLSCIVQCSKTKRVWQDVATSGVFEYRRVARLGADCHDAIAPIDLQKSPGIRIAMTISDDNQMRIVWHFHHACTDGQGAGRLLRDMFTVYEQLLSGKQPQLKLEPKLLLNRGRSETPEGESPIGLVEGLRNLWVTIRGRTARFPEIVIAKQSSSRHTTLVEAELGDALSSRIHELLFRQRIVLNDFALVASFMMLCHADLLTGGNHYLTVLNPVDLRTWADRRLPAANRVGLAFLRRRKSDCVKVQTLIESVAEQMRYVRQRGVGAEFIKGVALTDKIPAAQSLLLRWGRFIPTISVTCLSNFSVGRKHGFSSDGQNWKLDGAIVKRISGAAPLPYRVPLAVAVFDSGGKIRVTMRGCTQHFDAAMLDRLIGQWISGCESICQSDA